MVSGREGLDLCTGTTGFDDDINLGTVRTEFNGREQRSVGRRGRALGGGQEMNGAHRIGYQRTRRNIRLSLQIGRPDFPARRGDDLCQPASHRRRLHRNECFSDDIGREGSPDGAGRAAPTQGDDGGRTSAGVAGKIEHRERRETVSAAGGVDQANRKQVIP